MPEQILQFKFNGNDSEWNDIVEKLKQVYLIEEPPRIDETRTFLDTFDWRFFRKGLIFSITDNTYELRDMATNCLRGAFKWKRKTAMRFAWDIPDKELQKTFSAIQDERAVMPVASIESRRRTYIFMNNDRKTVLRMTQDTPQVIGKHQHHHFTLNSIMLFPVRGYSKYFKAVSEILENNGLLLLPPEHNILTAVLKVVDREPDDYSSKIKPHLPENIDSRSAAVTIFKELLQIIRQNEEGIKEDIDSEFLHDFRVAIRKTRSALSQIRQVFPEDDIIFFKQGFGTLGKMTNKMRDQDVYLLKKAHYMAMLPDVLRDGLKPFFAGIRRQRSKEHDKLLKRIESGDYRHFIKVWEEYLEQADKLPETPNANQPAKALGAKSIYKRFKKILKAGSVITPDTPDTEIHALRIQCKKLRYMLEFFTPLFPEDELNSLIGELKKLQTNLGDFNDMCAQILELEHKLQSLPPKKDSIAMAAALGGLIAALNRERLSIRKNFENTFEQFSAENNRAVFVRLFDNAPNPEEAES